MARADLSLFVDELLSQADIVQHISQYVALKKKGKTYWACCPFHEEKTASFSINPQKGLYHCFGCGIGGNLITFLMDRNKLGFVDAVRFLAEKEGRPMPGFMHESGTVQTREILDAALEYFRNTLNHNNEVRSFLTGERRRLKPETIEEYQLGYAADSWDGLLNHLRDKGFGIEDMIRQNLISKKSSAAENSLSFGSYYDRFRDRIMIPVFNHLGQLSGFAGRIFHEDDKQYGKYVNTSEETPLGKTSYMKMQILFGLDKAAQSIVSAGEAILTEGYFHHITSHQAGLLNVVASGGTAFTDEQAKLLRRYADKILIIMDPDNPGIKAARKAVETAYGTGFSPRLGLLPEGKDLDDIARTSSTREEVLQHVSFMDIPEFIMHTSSYDKKDPDSTHRVLEDIASLFQQEKNPARRLLWISDTAKKLEVPKEIVHRYIFRSTHPEKDRDKIDGDKIPDVLLHSYLYHMMTQPKNYRSPFFDEISPENRIFRSKAALKQLYEVIISETNNNPQHHLDIEMPQSDVLDFGVSKREQVYDYLKRKFMERSIHEFPFTLQAFLYERPKLDFKLTVAILRHYAREYARQDMVQKLADAHRNEDDVAKIVIRDELKKLL